MGAITIQPLSILNETIIENPVQQNSSPAPTTNPNLAQINGARPDTVILTGKVTESQLSGGDPNASQAQQTALFFAAQNIFLGQNNVEESGIPQQVQAPLVPTQTNLPGAPQQTTVAAANTPVIISADSGQIARQQQLLALDQSLQDVGINPQTISLFNRMALLLYASDPAVLSLLVHGLKGAAKIFRHGRKVRSAASSSETATSSAQPETESSNPSAANASANSSAQLESAQQSSHSLVEPILGQAGEGSGGSEAQGFTAPATGIANQYPRLQSTLDDIAIQDLQLEMGDKSVQPDAKGQGINIRV